MTRVATPENEVILLNIARHGTASHVGRTVRQFRRLERIEAAQLAAASHRQSMVHFRQAEDDAAVIHARLPAEVGELVKLAIERAAELAEAETCHAPDECHSSYDTFGRRRAEGLRLMAEQFLAREEQASGSGADRYQLVVHVDQDCWLTARLDGLCEIEDSAALAIETPMAVRPGSRIS